VRVSGGGGRGGVLCAGCVPLDTPLIDVNMIFSNILLKLRLCQIVICIFLWHGIGLDLNAYTCQNDTMSEVIICP
jgi:hypothetical protein